MPCVYICHETQRKQGEICEELSIDLCLAFKCCVWSQGTIKLVRMCMQMRGIIREITASCIMFSPSQ